MSESRDKTIAGEVDEKAEYAKYQGKSVEEMRQIIIKLNIEYPILAKKQMEAQMQRSVDKRNGVWTDSQENELNQLTEALKQFEIKWNIARDARNKIEEDAKNNKQIKVKNKGKEKQQLVKENKPDAKKTLSLFSTKKHVNEVKEGKKDPDTYSPSSHSEKK